MTKSEKDAHTKHHKQKPVKYLARFTEYAKLFFKTANQRY
jgi:hypothetical protein